MTRDFEGLKMSQSTPSPVSGPPIVGTEGEGEGDEDEQRLDSVLVDALVKSRERIFLYEVERILEDFLQDIK